MELSLIYYHFVWVIKGCKTFSQIGVAIRTPESKMAAKMAATFFYFYPRWTRESPNTTLYVLSTAAKPVLKMALQSGHQNPRWPTKWPLQYLYFNLDGLESHLIPFCMGYQGMQNHS